MKKFIITISIICGITGLWACGDAGMVSYEEYSGEAVLDAENTEDAALVLEESDESAANTSDVIYVEVAGAVKCPGVYSFSPGERVFAAIEAAGGFRDDAFTSDINRAALLNDADKIVVLTQEEAKSAKEAETSAAAEDSDTEASSLVDINSADASLLTSLPGIGDAKANAIIAYREENGAFLDASDIVNVSGIGESTYANIKDLICAK